MPELVQMMEDLPMQGDGWEQDPEILVTTLSLEQYWDCFWSDNAPYYLQAVERDAEDEVLSSTTWGEPTPGFETEVQYDVPVLQERRLDKLNRIRAAFAPDHGKEHIRFQLLEKSATKIKIKETHVNGDEVPYGDTFEIWMVWEVLTPDPLSQQVVFRKQFYLHWIDEPWVSGTI